MTSQNETSRTYLSITFLFLGIIFWFIAFSIFQNKFSFVIYIYDQKRIFQLLLIYLALTLIILFRCIRKDIYYLLPQKKSLTTFLLASLLCLGLLSSLNAEFKLYAFTEFFTLIGLSLLALLIAALTKKAPQITLITLILSSMSFMLIYEIKFLTSYLIIFITGDPIKFYSLFPYFLNVRFFNQYQIILIPLSILPIFIFSFNNRGIAFFLYLTSGLWIMILFASQSRGALLSIAIALLFTHIAFRKDFKKHIAKLASVLAIGLFFYILLFSMIPMLSSNHHQITEIMRSTSSLNIRLELWSKALKFISENPTLGIGPMHYAFHPAPNAHPHNSVLLIASEYGLPFLMCSVILLIIFITKWINTTRNLSCDTPVTLSLKKIITSDWSSTKTVHIFLFLSLFQALIYSQFSGVLVMPQSQTMLFLLAGIMIGLYHSKKNHTKSFETVNSLSIQVFAGTLLIALIYATLPYFTKIAPPPFSYKYNPVETSGPRYWTRGGLTQTPPRFTETHRRLSTLKPRN